MKIYTSYFAKSKELENDGIFPVGICLKVPSFFKYPNFASLAPTAAMIQAVKQTGNEEQYVKDYTSQVLSLHKDPTILYNRLEYVGHGKDIALMCYEKPGDFCHRHIVADWLSKSLGIDVKEYEFVKEPPSFSLF